MNWQPTMLKFHKESDFHLPQSQNCLLGDVYRDQGAGVSGPTAYNIPFPSVYVITGHYPIIPCLLSSLFWFVLHGRYAWCSVNKKGKSKLLSPIFAVDHEAYLPCIALWKYTDKGHGVIGWRQCYSMNRCVDRHRLSTFFDITNIKQVCTMRGRQS